MDGRSLSSGDLVPSDVILRRAKSPPRDRTRVCITTAVSGTIHAAETFPSTHRCIRRSKVPHGGFAAVQD